MTAARTRISQRVDDLVAPHRIACLDGMSGPNGLASKISSVTLRRIRHCAKLRMQSAGTPTTTPRRLAPQPRDVVDAASEPTDDGPPRRQHSADRLAPGAGSSRRATGPKAEALAVPSVGEEEERGHAVPRRSRAPGETLRRHERASPLPSRSRSKASAARHRARSDRLARAARRQLFDELVTSRCRRTQVLDLATTPKTRVRHRFRVELQPTIVIQRAMFSRVASYFRFPL